MTASTGGLAAARAAGAAVTATVTITASALPTVSITATGTPVADSPTTFTVTAAATAPATVRSVIVDFGDGAVQTFGNTTSVAHTYRSGGTFTVTATVEDTNGGRSTGSTVVAVQASAPLVSLTVNSPVTVNAILRFAVTVSQNPGNVPVQAVSFSFGDGAVREVQSLSTTYRTLARHLRGQRDRAVHQRPDGDGERSGPRELTTLFDAAAALAILGRLERLTPASQAQWGKMDVAQMLCHVTRALHTPRARWSHRRCLGLSGCSAA